MRCASASPSWARSASPATATWPAAGAGAARPGVPVAYSEGFTPRPRLQLRPGAADRRRVDRRVPRHRARRAPDGARRRRRGCRARSDAPARRVRRDSPRSSWRRAAGSLQEDVTSLHVARSTLAALERTSRRRRSPRLLAADALPLTRERKGERRVDDVRPLIVVGSGGVRPTSHGRACSRRAGHPARRGLRPSRARRGWLSRAPTASTLRVLRTHQWIEHDGDRRELLPLRRRDRRPLSGAP